MEKKFYFRTILEWRERLYSFYTGYEKYIRALAKFILSFVIFYMISNQLHYQEKLANPLICLGLSVIGVILPYSILTIMAFLSVVLQLYFLSPVFSVMVAAIAVILYLMVARYDSKTMIISVLLPVFIIWRIPFALALIVGLSFGPASMLSAACGVALYYIVKATTEIKAANSINVTDVLDMAQKFMDAVIKNKDMYVMLAAVIGVMFVTWLIRTRKMKYAFEMGILGGSASGVLIILTGNLAYEADFSMSWIFVSTLISAILAFIVQYMRMVLDYGQVEEVQFEDDDYYYYVKAVPKLKMTIGEKKVKKIYSKK